MGEKISSVDRAYIAGFFDGEGCISAHGKHQQVYLMIGQRRPAVLEYIHARLGVGNIHRSTRGYYMLRVVGTENIKWVIRLIYPYSIVKRAELRVAWRLLNLIGPVGVHPIPKNRRRKRLALMKELKEMKHG